MSDPRYTAEEQQGLTERALYEAERRIKKLRRELIGIQSACDNRLKLSSEELIGEIAERAFEALQNDSYGKHDDD